MRFVWQTFFRLSVIVKINKKLLMYTHFYVSFFVPTYLYLSKRLNIDDFI